MITNQKKINILFQRNKITSNCLCFSERTDCKLRFKNAIRECTETMGNRSEEFIDSLAPVLGEATNELQKLVQGFDHVGFIPPPDLFLDDMAASAFDDGYNTEINILRSKVMSRCLGKLIGKEEVPTKIYKARKQDHKGIELLIPEENKEIVEHWISTGEGFHFAFKLKERRDMETTVDLFKTKNIALKDGFGGKPLENHKEGSIISYFVINLGDQKVSIEFCYY